jgi:crotonobetainyl-CoA:carnitine CoA-transferase CaiB-like acyl-CoA transferase
MITDQPVNDHDDLRKVTDNMLREVGLSIGDSGGKVTFAGAEPIRKTTMKAGAAPAIILAANAIAEAAIWKERTGEGQDIHIDLRKAWIEQSPWQLDAAPYTIINGASKMFNFGVYVVLNPQCPTRDGRFMIMCPLYPSQERKILRLLNCGPDESQLRAAIIKRDASEMEAAAEALQVPFQMIRTREEWEASEQGQVNGQTPLISIEKIGESDPIPLPQGERPLSGLRVLSMVHAVAGPCCPRTLAGQGADCLNLNMPDWIEYGNFFYQADVGLRQAYLDARKAENRKHVYNLIKDADVFVDNLRPGVADTEGYSAQALAERKPGIIACSVKLNAHRGPWSHWPGFDINAHGITGLATAEGTPGDLRHHDRLPRRNRSQGRPTPPSQGGRQLPRGRLPCPVLQLHHEPRAQRQRDHRKPGKPRRGTPDHEAQPHQRHDRVRGVHEARVAGRGNENPAVLGRPAPSRAGVLQAGVVAAIRERQKDGEEA